MRLFPAVICLMLAMPSFASAAKTAPEQEAPGNHQNQGLHMKRHGKERIPFEIMEVEIINWAEKYTPERAGEWKAVLKERQELQDRWLSPEMAGKRMEWKKEKRKKLAEIRVLKKQLEAGEITREEFLNKAYEKMKEKGGPVLKGHTTFPRLKEAAEKGDAKEAALLLNEMLDFFKKHNEMIRKRMEN